MSQSASLRQKVNVQEVLQASQRRATATTAKATVADSKFAQIQTNPFFSTVFNPELSPEQKKSELTKLRVYEGTKEENREKAKAYDLFKEYLQEQREMMAREIIALTDTETFAELQSTYRDINDALIQFEEDMTPLTDIIDAVYALRTSGKTLDAFKEIKLDTAREQENTRRRELASKELADRKADVNRISAQILELENSSSSKKFFGLGGLKDEVVSQLSHLKVQLDNAITRFSDAEKEMSAANSATVDGMTTMSDDPEENARLLEAKSKLKELLDLSSDQHTERQKQLVASALNFINTSKERIGSIREHLGGMDGQIENLSDTNQHMMQIYAIMTEAEKEAALENQRKRDALAAASESENLIEKMNRETLQRDIDEHIKSVAQSTVDTQATYADLAGGSVRILTMKDATQTQIVKAREMHSRGVGGIADRLSTVLQAVSGAAISEAQSMAQDTHRHMMESTNRIAQKESIRVAMGVNETNDELVKLMADLESYGEVSKASTEIVRAGLTEMQENLDKIAAIRDDVQQGIKDAIGVASEVAGSKNEKAGRITIKNPSGSTATSPFKLGKAS